MGILWKDPNKAKEEKPKEQATPPTKPDSISSPTQSAPPRPISRPVVVSSLGAISAPRPLSATRPSSAQPADPEFSGTLDKVLQMTNDSALTAFNTLFESMQADLQGQPDLVIFKSVFSALKAQGITATQVIKAMKTQTTALETERSTFQNALEQDAQSLRTSEEENIRKYEQTIADLTRQIQETQNKKDKSNQSIATLDAQKAEATERFMSAFSPRHDALDELLRKITQFAS